MAAAMTQPACLVLAELGAADELRWWVWHCPLETCKHTSGAQPGTAYAPWVPQHRCCPSRLGHIDVGCCARAPLALSTPLFGGGGGFCLHRQDTLVAACDQCG
tara:strand:+ start:374 stop:682 length:309 start_codon:yes stop_codon:yes gene_type:complete